MNKYLVLCICVLLLGACSSPKYAYYFDHYDYNSGKKKSAVVPNEADLAQIELPAPVESPLKVDAEAMTASTEPSVQPVEAAPVAPAEVDMEKQKALLAEKYSSLSKEEKKEFRKELKTVVKKAVKAKKEGKSLDSIEETKAMDYDLKMALIFGVVGVVLSALGGVNSVFWVLGVISIVVAIVFLIKWIAEQ
jgi:hypothetical protein